MTCDFAENKPEVPLVPTLGCCGDGTWCVWVFGDLCLPGGKGPYLSEEFMWFSLVGILRPWMSSSSGCSPRPTFMLLQASFGSNARVPAALCWLSFRLGSRPSIPFERWDVVLPNAMWLGLPRCLFLAPPGHASASFSLPPCCLHLRFDRGSTRTPFPPGARPREPLPSTPLAFPLRHRPGRDAKGGSYPIVEGRNVPCLVEDVSDRWTGPVGWCAGERDQWEGKRTDPHPTPSKILPRRDRHPRPKKEGRVQGEEWTPRGRRTQRIVIVGRES